MTHFSFLAILCSPVLTTLIACANVNETAKGDIGKLYELTKGTDYPEQCSKLFPDIQTSQNAYVPAIPSYPAFGICSDDAFEINKVLGAGKFSKVYAGTHLLTQTKVSLKFLGKKYSAQRLRMEECLPHRINSPFIRKHYCTYYSSSSQKMVLVLEHVEGVDMMKWIYKNGTIPPELLCRLSAQLALALMTLHLHSITFIDLKPENIIISPNGLDVMLIDFGLACDSTWLISGITNQLAGSPLYMAPENVKLLKAKPFSLPYDINVKFTDPVADWYSYGVVLHMLYSLLPPYNIQDVSTIPRPMLLQKIMKGPCLDQCKNADLKAFLLDIMKKNPKERLGHDRSTFQTILEHPWFHPVGNPMALLESRKIQETAEILGPSIPRAE